MLDDQGDTGRWGLSVVAMVAGVWCCISSGERRGAMIAYWARSLSLLAGIAGNSPTDYGLGS